MASIVNAKDVVVSLNGTVIGCLQSLSITINQALDEATCTASGGWSQVSPGTRSWSGSLGNLYRNFTDDEADEQIAYENAFDMITEGTLVEITYGTNVNGDTRYRGNAYLSSVGFDKPDAGNTTWSADFTGSGPLEKYTITTPLVVPA